jgi:uncharacterized protein YbaR (Trm112 family)
MDARDLQAVTREGHRIADVLASPACLSDETLEAYERSQSERIAARLKEAAEPLCEAKDLALATGAGELYTWLCGRIGELDGTRNVLLEREARSE